MCVCGRGGGYSDIFIYIRRLGPFLGVQNLEFQYFFFFFFFFFGGGGGVQKYHYFWVFEDFVDISLQTGLVLGVISIHFRVFFLKVNVQDGDIIWGSPKLQIFFGV